MDSDSTSHEGKTAESEVAPRPVFKSNLHSAWCQKCFLQFDNKKSLRKHLA